MKEQTLLWFAQGFGIGRIPFAPGTFGSVLGLAWFALLLALGNVYVYLIGLAAGIGLSVWLCGEGERILGKKDPGSVVMDEIIAIPICLLAWVTTLYFRTGALPEPGYFFNAHLPLTAGVFLTFRFFDILKPWPVGKSQSLPGGWGVTVDDVLAALYVNAAFALALKLWPSLI
jgi:phosphatidylglycerophosphatase A